MSRNFTDLMAFTHQDVSGRPFRMILNEEFDDTTTVLTEALDLKLGSATRYEIPVHLKHKFGGQRCTGCCPAALPFSAARSRP